MAIANGIKLVGIIFTHSILMLQNVNNSELTLHGSVSSLFCMGTHCAHYTGGIVCMSSSTSTYRWFQLFFIKSGIVNFFPQKLWFYWHKVPRTLAQLTGNYKYTLLLI